VLKTLRNIPLPITLVVLSFIAPTELSLYAGGLRLPPHRVMLLVLFVAAIVKMARGRAIQLMACDYLFLLYGLWSLGVFSYHDGSGAGLQFGGSLAVESFASYFVARVFITSYERLVACLQILLFALIVAGGFALASSITGQHIVHDALKSITGIDVETGYEYRRGLLRAYSTFDHPILYGSFCASLLALLWTVPQRAGTSRRNACLVAGATFLGMSSAPMLCIGVQTGLLVWERLSRGIPRRALLTVAGMVAALVSLGTVSNRSPFAIIATGFTLDPWTGYYRLIIWEAGLDNVARSPWVGIGLADWTRPWWMASDSIDAFWLVVMMRMGVPALVLLLAAIGLLLYATHNQRTGMTRQTRRLVIAWTFSIIALSLAGCTVHYWNNVHAYFFFLMGMMAWVGDKRLARQRLRMAPSANGRAVAAPRPPWAPPEWRPADKRPIRTPLPLNPALAHQT
jgi:hypothetical protein